MSPKYKVTLDERPFDVEVKMLDEGGVLVVKVGDQSFTMKSTPTEDDSWIVNDLTTDFKECPNVRLSFRLKIRDYLNNLEKDAPGTKKNIISWFMSLVPRKNAEKISIMRCDMCGSPCSGTRCNSCKLEV